MVLLSDVPCSLTYPEVDVFTGAGRFEVVVVDDDESHFVPLIAETVDSYVSCGDFVRLYGLPRVRPINFVLHSYSSHSVAPALSYRLQVKKLSVRKKVPAGVLQLRVVTRSEKKDSISAHQQQWEFAVTYKNIPNHYFT